VQPVAKKLTFVECRNQNNMPKIKAEMMTQSGHEGWPPDDLEFGGVL